MNDQSNRQTPWWRKRGAVIGIAVVVVLLVGPVAGEAFVWFKDVDIRSGRLRQRWTVLGVTVRQQVEDSWVSRWGEPREGEQWRPAISKSGANHVSPHYRYHGVPSQIRILELIDQGTPMTDAARRHLANRVLKLWQKGHYHPVDEYLRKVEIIAMQRWEQPGKMLTQNDLP